MSKKQSLEKILHAIWLKNSGKDFAQDTKCKTFTGLALHACNSDP